MMALNSYFHGALFCITKADIIKNEILLSRRDCYLLSSETYILFVRKIFHLLFFHFSVSTHKPYVWNPFQGTFSAFVGKGECNGCQLN